MNSKKIFNVTIASAVAASGIVAVAPTQADAAQSFPDVVKTNSHYDAIMELADRKVITGFTDGTFGPNKSVTRGQAAKIIAGLADLDTTNLKDPGFKDVPKTHQYYSQIASLYNAGIINGYGNDTFGPSDTLTRSQMAKIITLAFNLQGTTELPFTDVSKNNANLTYIAALFTNNVTTGTTATTYSPADKVTRGQLSSFVIRAEKATAQAQVKTIDATISKVIDGKVMVGTTEYEVAPELVNVFSADNAAALKEADVELVVEYTSEKVASLAPVAVKMHAKIIGIKKVKLTQPNTTFNAKGFKIPDIIIAAKNVTLQQIVTTLVTLLKDATVVIEKSQVDKIEAAEKEAVTVDETSKVEEIVVVEETTTKPEEPKEETPIISGGTGVTVTQTALDKVVTAAVSKANTEYKDVLTFSFNASTNVINVTVIDGGKTIASVREDLKSEADGSKLTLTNLLDDLSVSEAGAILADVTTVTVKAGTKTKVAKVEDYITSSFDVERAQVVKEADQFIDDAIKATGKSVLTLADVKSVFSNNVTIKAGAETYTVTVK